MSAWPAGSSRPALRERGVEYLDRYVVETSLSLADVAATAALLADRRAGLGEEVQIRVVADAACEAGRYQWSMTGRRILVAVSMLLLALVGATLFVNGRADGVEVDPHGTALPAQREVQVSLSMPSPSSSDGLHAKLVRGTMPSVAVQATVLTDEQCQPDARGLSHCLNRMRLPDGSELELRHPHDMSTVPCLAPGEKVRLMPGV